MISSSPSLPPLFRAAPQQAPAIPLFDVHANLGVTDTDGIGYGRLTADEYLGLMDDAGVHRVCAFPPLMANYDRANIALRDWAMRQSACVLPFARLGGPGGPRPIRQFWQARRAVRARLLREPGPAIDLDGFAGIKLIPHLSGLPEAAIFEAINQRGLPVLVHAGQHSPPSWIARRLLPRLCTPVILAHLGAYPTEADLLAEAVDLAAREPQIHLDTSGVWVSEFLRFAAQRVPHKLLFGSDAPLAHPRVAWLQLATAVRDDRQLEAIGRLNAERLFAPWIERRPQHA
ncbi:amidohydrolase family protein [Salinisphaera sp. SPP-AMP-43]|uniref:amidohydrolase family protein n=1 Tax=Salinisphaera sp. SPP-AMP-43 TaxID=3121288 RepID=UPI003C6E06CF